MRTRQAETTLEVAYMLCCFALWGAPVEPMILGWARSTLWRNGARADMLTAAGVKSCEACGKDFEPFQSMQRVCPTVRCAKKFATAKRLAVEARERASTKARREALKTTSDWIKEAQTAFNAWVRARDLAAGHGCIDCGKPFELAKHGGSVDAGHYLSRGSAPHLKFDERNVFAQRKNCNRPGGATRADFRAGVIQRIGLPAVEALEADQTVKQYRADDLRAIRDEYRARLKALQRGAT